MTGHLLCVASVEGKDAWGPQEGYQDVGPRKVARAALPSGGPAPRPLPPPTALHPTPASPPRPRLSAQGPGDGNLLV